MLCIITLPISCRPQCPEALEDASLGRHPFWPLVDGFGEGSCPGSTGCYPSGRFVSPCGPISSPGAEPRPMPMVKRARAAVASRAQVLPKGTRLRAVAVLELHLQVMDRLCSGFSQGAVDSCTILALILGSIPWIIDQCGAAVTGPMLRNRSSTRGFPDPAVNVADGQTRGELESSRGEASVSVLCDVGCLLNMSHFLTVWWSSSKMLGVARPWG